MSKSSTVNQGIKPIGLLWVALIVLKIIGYLSSLSWWIIIPFPILAYISLWIIVIGFFAAIGIVGFLLFLLADGFEKIANYFKKPSKK